MHQWEVKGVIMVQVFGMSRRLRKAAADRTYKWPAVKPGMRVVAGDGPLTAVGMALPKETTQPNRRQQNTGANSIEGELPGFDGILGAKPFAPAPLQGIHLGETVIYHFVCQTGTGGFIGSGTVQNVFFVFWVCSHPIPVGTGFYVSGAFDFEFR